LNFRLSFYDFP